MRISAAMAAALHEHVPQLRQRAGGGDLWASLPKQHLVMQLLQRCCVQAGERLVVLSEGLQPLRTCSSWWPSGWAGSWAASSWCSRATRFQVGQAARWPGACCWQRQRQALGAQGCCVLSG